MADGRIVKVEKARDPRVVWAERMSGKIDDVHDMRERIVVTFDFSEEPGRLGAVNHIAG